MLSSRQIMHIVVFGCLFTYGFSLALFMIDYATYTILLEQYPNRVCLVDDTVIKLPIPGNLISAEVLLRYETLKSWFQVGSFSNISLAQRYLHVNYPLNSSVACYASSTDIRLVLSESYSTLTACLVFFIAGSILMVIYAVMKIIEIMKRRGYINLDDQSPRELDFTYNHTNELPQIDFASITRSFDHAQYYMWQYRTKLSADDFDELRRLQMDAIMGPAGLKTKFQSAVHRKLSDLENPT